MIAHRIQTLILHPAKTGGTSLENAVIRRELGMAGNLHYSQRQMYALWTPDNRHHWPLAKLLRHFPFLAEWRRICTVRHPYARAVSEFRYQLQIQKVGAATRSHATRDINRAIMTGDLWKPAWPWHAEPQASYVDERTELLRCENLCDDFARAFGYELEPHKFKTERDGIPEANELSEEAKMTLQAFWPNDFEELGYER